MNNLASTTCPVCKGEKILVGRSRDPADFGRFRSIICNECGGVGVVPADGDLAQWREDMRSMMGDTALFLRDHQPKQVMLLLRKLDAHLAAMPQSEQGAE